MNKKDNFWINSMEWCKKYCGCHQIPDRSFFIKGYQFPLCARCTGIALGHMAAVFLSFSRTFSYKTAILMIPLAVDGTMQQLTPYESNNAKRFVTGVLYGFSFTSIILHFFKSMIKKFRFQ